MVISTINFSVAIDGCGALLAPARYGTPPEVVVLQCKTIYSTQRR